MPLESVDFWTGIGHNAVISIVFVLIAVALFPFLWKIIDKITPGDLNKELLGQNEQKSPNIALAIVVAAMVIAFGLILAAAIH